MPWRRAHDPRDRLRRRRLRRVREHPQRVRRDPRPAHALQAPPARRARGAAGGAQGLSMHVLVVGVSHHTARLETRQRLALDNAAAESLLRELVAGGAVADGGALSTCNRTALYLAASDADVAERAALGP